MLLEDFCKKIDAVPMSVIDDIKAEIENEADFCECMPNGKCLSPKKVIEIIDKHTERSRHDQRRCESMYSNIDR